MAEHTYVAVMQYTPYHSGDSGRAVLTINADWYELIGNVAVFYVSSEECEMEVVGEATEVLYVYRKDLSGGPWDG